MSSVQAVTEDLNLVVRIASFYLLDSDTQKQIVTRVSDLMAEIGKENNFIVWRTVLNSKESDA
jgi:hypothetical protein